MSLANQIGDGILWGIFAVLVILAVAYLVGR